MSLTPCSPGRRAEPANEAGLSVRVAGNNVRCWVKNQLSAGNPRAALMATTASCTFAIGRAIGFRYSIERDTLERISGSREGAASPIFGEPLGGSDFLRTVNRSTCSGRWRRLTGEDSRSGQWRNPLQLRSPGSSARRIYPRPHAGHRFQGQRLRRRDRLGPNRSLSRYQLLNDRLWVDCVAKLGRSRLQSLVLSFDRPVVCALPCVGFGVHSGALSASACAVLRRFANDSSSDRSSSLSLRGANCRPAIANCIAVANIPLTQRCESTETLMLRTCDSGH